MKMKTSWKIDFSVKYILITLIVQQHVRECYVCVSNGQIENQTKRVILAGLNWCFLSLMGWRHTKALPSGETCTWGGTLSICLHLCVCVPVYGIESIITVRKGPLGVTIWRSDPFFKVDYFREGKVCKSTKLH